MWGKTQFSNKAAQQARMAAFRITLPNALRASILYTLNSFLISTW
jgi:hypothetical protein